MTRKIIIDCDPGIDDAVALTAALFDPRLNVLAITATAGTVSAEQATANVDAIVAAIDPPRLPRIGKATTPEEPAYSGDKMLNGSHGLGDFVASNSARHHVHTSEKVIAELLRQSPGEVTLVCLGPLTNLARLCQRDPSVIPLINQVVISGGAYRVPGNASAVAEYNLHFDPASADEVFASPTTKSLVPLDISDQINFGVDLIEQLPSKFTKAGQFLHQILPFAFRAAHRQLGRELISLVDATTIAAVVEPELFHWTEMAGRVETKGELTSGMSVFDCRLRPEWNENMEVAVGGDIEAIRELVLRGLRYAGQQS
ncbi:MAG: nucleoside hydrolase [Planctomycetota bacterium]